MKILVTGVHFTPAQALIEELKKYPGIEIIYLGRRKTMEADATLSVESQVLPKLGVKLVPIVAGRLRRDLSLETILSLIKLPIGFVQAFYYLIKYSPDVVVSFGGYIGLPVVFSAWLLSIPTLIHEQGLYAGLANRLSSIFADKAAVSFDKTYEFPKEKIVLTGNPVRSELLNGRKSVKTKTLPLILILGGNQGSLTINRIVWEALGELTKVGMVVHQTGQSKYGNYEQALNKQKSLEHPQRYKPLRWIDARDLVGFYKNASLVISRAGINTLLELSYFGIPSLIIPLTTSEQKLNASYFQERGLGQTLSQSQLTPNSLSREVRKILGNTSELKGKAKLAKKIIIPYATQKLAQEVFTLGEKNI